MAEQRETPQDAAQRYAKLASESAVRFKVGDPSSGYGVTPDGSGVIIFARHNLMLAPVAIIVPSSVLMDAAKMALIHAVEENQAHRVTRS